MLNIENIVKEIFATINDKNWNDFLTYITTTELRPNDFKYIEYTKTGNFIIINDIDGQLGNFAEKVTDKKIAEYKVPNPLKGKTINDLIKYLKSMGVKEGTVKKVKKHIHYD